MQSRILDPKWFYDKLANAIQDKLKEDEENYDYWRSKKISVEEMTPRQRATPLELPSGGKTDGVEFVREKYELSRDSLDIAKSRLEELRKAKPFLMGGATLESLLNTEPENYEYITNGKLPFDNVFFEFSETVETQLPFVPGKVRFSGMKILRSTTNRIDYTRTINHDINSYFMDAYFIDDKSEIHHINLHFTPRTNGDIDGSIVGLNNKDKDGLIWFSLDTDNRLIKYSKTREERIKTTHQTKELLKWDGTGERPPEPTFEREVKLSEGDQGFGIVNRLPSLATNLVNYINAHNINVVKREREVIELEREERNKKKRKVSNKEFYLVTVQDKTYWEPDSPREVGHRTLQERIYVRGHDRRYRDDKGNIRMTIWVSPCVKGPPNAPFKESRYQVLYDKLKREKEMMAKYNLD